MTCHSPLTFCAFTVEDPLSSRIACGSHRRQVESVNEPFFALRRAFVSRGCSSAGG